MTIERKLLRIVFDDIISSKRTRKWYCHDAIRVAIGKKNETKSLCYQIVYKLW